MFCNMEKPSNVWRKKKKKRGAIGDDLLSRTWGTVKKRFPLMVILGMVMQPIIGFTTWSIPVYKRMWQEDVLLIVYSI